MEKIFFRMLEHMFKLIFITSQYVYLTRTINRQKFSYFNFPGI